MAKKTLAGFAGVAKEGASVGETQPTAPEKKPTVQETQPVAPEKQPEQQEQTVNPFAELNNAFEGTAKRKKKQINVYVDADVFDKYEAWGEDKQKGDKSKLVEMLLENFFKSLEK